MGIKQACSVTADAEGFELESSDRSARVTAAKRAVRLSIQCARRLSDGRSQEDKTVVHQSVVSVFESVSRSSAIFF